MLEQARREIAARPASLKQIADKYLIVTRAQGSRRLVGDRFSGAINLIAQMFSSTHEIEAADALADEALRALATRPSATRDVWCDELGAGRVLVCHALARRADGHRVWLQRASLHTTTRFLADTQVTIALAIQLLIVALCVGAWRAHSIRRSVAIVERSLDDESLVMHGVLTEFEPLIHKIARRHETTQRVTHILHDIKGPIANVVRFAELMRLVPDMDHAQRESALGALERSSDRLVHFVDELLAVARAEASLPQQARESIEVAPALRAIFEDAQRQWPHLTITLKAPDDALRILAVPRAIERAVENLVANAARHARATIRIWTESLEHETRIVVEDDGEGIEDGKKDEIFGVFVSSAEGARGVGLSIVRAVARAHGGSAWCEDAEGGGARFVLAISHDGTPPSTA